ncbi:deoxyguanosinetriphosphate triphosphohydrolase [Pseudonocardiaceae bacterium YIM PH 21723]|nr:deoxyguanosinetriphosphate triphosphohydrolase [Pseudonocardiaceae bacterium YIM PH 21723]
MTGYSAADSERLSAEAPKQAGFGTPGAGGRSPFARDRARVLHSAALRRLAAKTQVVGPGEGDVPRTRLTHSLEVAQIGRGIADELGTDPDIVDTAGLAHDIGHPPFGHNGERALNEAAVACGGFEGNAQTLRILTRLEPKVLEHGLNLTRASLDAATKYPWPRKPGQVKFGVYADDLPVFHWLREGAPGQRQCLEAQIMDWSDDVAYSVHDVEDAVISGRIELRSLTDSAERTAIAELAAGFTDQPVEALAQVAKQLLDLEVVAALAEDSHDGSVTAQVALKRMTSELVGRFASAAVSGTREAYGPEPLRRYEANLVVPERIQAEVAVLKAMALRYVMSDPERRRMQKAQRVVISELVDALLRGAPGELDPAFQPAWQRADGEAERLRVVIDQVAILTDAQALSWHGRLAG